MGADARSLSGGTASAPEPPVGPPRSAGPLHTPPGHPVFGHAREIRADPLGTFLRWRDRYGDVVRVKLRHWTLLLNHPEDVRNVLVSHQSRYRKGEAFRVGRSVFGQGLLASEDPLHLAQRHLMQPAFHRETLPAYARTMVERTIGLSSGWAPGGEVDLAEEMTRLTLGIAARTMFGTEDVAETAQLARAVDVAQSFLYTQQTSLVPFPEWLPTPSHVRYHRAVDVMDRLVYGIIAARRRDPGSASDLLSLLLRARDDAGHGMEDRQLRDEALTLLLAGHETTANALSWTFHLLAGHREIEELLLEELRSTLDGSLPSFSDLPRLAYTDQVIGEALRLYPPAWIVPRIAAEEDELPSGVRIVPGQEVVLSPWTTHRDPRFFPEPDRFDPDRFAPERKGMRPVYAYFPFGGGNRRCIGEPFARMEMALVLATLLPRFRFEEVPGQEIVPEPRVTLRPRNGIRVRLLPRRARTDPAT